MPSSRHWEEIVQARDKGKVDALPDKLIIIANRARHSQGINMQANALSRTLPRHHVLALSPNCLSASYCRSSSASFTHTFFLLPTLTSLALQADADAIVCRPTPGDQLEQMKGRIDRPGQRARTLQLIVLMAEHTIEEAEVTLYLSTCILLDAYSAACHL